jgi:hypothetical protein
MIRGFETGDMVRAEGPKGKHGIHVGHVAVRAVGSFRAGKTDSINWKYCR